MRKFTDWGPAVLVVIATLLALLLAPSMVRRVEHAQTSARISLARQSLGEDDILERLDQAIRRVAEAVEPSVAHIDVRLSGRNPFATSSGSGWVFDGRGHVVTNAHVVRGAERIRVQLSDGRLFVAEVVGADPLTDIAVLKLPTEEGLFPAVRATGAHPRQGERVFAFGSPFGFKFSMSEGIISGLGREPAGAVALATGYTNFIQTDAAVNPGNSGGPLANIRGELIGMNVAIATGADSQGTTEGQSAGISFAIPLPVIESVVTQLIESGTVQRGFLGINLPRRDDRVQDAGYNGYGVYVEDVTPDGPAAQAGILPGDVIVRIGGEPVLGVGVLRSLISTVRPGESVAIDVWRGGETIETRPVLTAAPTTITLGAGTRVELHRAGLQLNDGQNDVGEDPPIITAVVPGSWAEEAGFERNQRVVSVAGQEVRTLDEFMAALADAGLLNGGAVEVLVAQQDLDSRETVQRLLTLRLSR
jgi:S1-C subfamily serine protease